MSSSNNISVSDTENGQKKRKLWKFVSWTPDEYYLENSEQKIKKIQTAEGKEFVTIKMKYKNCEKRRKIPQDETTSSHANTSLHQPIYQNQDVPPQQVYQQYSENFQPVLVSEVPINYIQPTMNLQHLPPRDTPSLYNPANSTINHNYLVIDNSQIDLLLAHLLAQQTKPPPV